MAPQELFTHGTLSNDSLDIGNPSLKEGKLHSILAEVAQPEFIQPDLVTTFELVSEKAFIGISS